VEGEEERQLFANNAPQELEKASNHMMARKIVEVVKVEKQIVSGIVYTVQMKLATTQCKRGATIEQLNACPESDAEARELCKVKIWEQAWKNFREIQSLTCTQEASDPTDSTAGENNEPLPLLGQHLINIGHTGRRRRSSATERSPVKHHVHLLGLDGHDLQVHGTADHSKHHKNRDSNEKVNNLKEKKKSKSRHHMQLPRNHKMLLKEPHMVSGVEFPPLMNDKESKKKLEKLQRHRNFKKFVKKFNKDYENAAEYEKRYQVFRENMKKVQFLRELKEVQENMAQRYLPILPRRSLKVKSWV